MEVADLLTASRAAHQAAIPRKGRSRDLTVLLRAAELRDEALALDPDRTDPEWANDKASHADLMAFYAEKLGARE